MLGVLAANRRTVVSVDTLVDALWPDDPPASARASLRTYVSRLRAVVGDAVRAEAGGYRLDAEVDADRFANYLSAAAGQTPAEALGQVDAALDLWRGSPFGGEDAYLLAGRVAALQELHDTAIERRARCLCEVGRCVEAVASAEAVLAQHPFREGTWAVLVSSLASAGRKVEALRAAQSARSVLAEAGLEPGEQLLAAERVALEHGATAIAGRPVPIPVGSLIGRDDEVVTVGDLMVGHRLVSLIGPGGVGKTRLALEAAHRGRERHVRGAVLAELARIDAASSVADALVDSLGLTRRGSAEETLIAAAGLDVLLLIDNCEHLVAEVARLVWLLLTSGPHIRMLVTSRTRLAVEGELVHRVDPLTVAGPGAGAVRLFVERTAATGVPVAEEEMGLVSRIVTRLDGLPLAIEMAAARAFGLGVRGLAEEVESDLSSLRSGHRDPSPRHRTLHATIEWSLAGLGEPARRCLAEMSVFAGPAALDALKEVLSDGSPAEHVLELAERSLVHVTHRHGRARFGLLETVREFGRNLVGDPDAIDELRRRHAGYVLGRARSLAAQVAGAEEASAGAAFDELFDEVRSAVIWCRHHDPQQAIALLHTVLPWARTRQRGEAYEWTSWMIADLGESNETARLIGFMAHNAADAGSLALAHDLARRAMELSPDPEVAVTALDARADAAIYGGDLVAAIEHAERFFEVAMALNNRHSMALALSTLAMAHGYGGDQSAAVRVLERMATLSTDPPSARGWLLYSRAEVTGGDQPDLALEALEEAIRLADSVNNPFLSGVARVTRLSLLARVAEARVVSAGYAELIGHWQARNDLTHQVTTLRNVALFLSRQGAHGEVVALLAALQAGDLPPSFGAEAVALAEAEALAHRQLKSQAFEHHCSIGARRKFDQAVAHVIEVLRTGAWAD